ncbi:DUF1476 domain-containing protein [Woodsholea maritima]|uniref:DUF1476 domain-containing protein n=1 Tax=Woodsholea maritima TaxID=240237 RepID=UPI00037B013F|nr:DUF1476 domain-containing protein [Woodsholea maritima]
MSGLDDRESAFENKFAHDQDLEFKAVARRNKLLGLWAAELMGLSGDEANAYAAEVVKSDFEEVGEEDVFRKVSGDLAAKNVDQSEHQIRRQMADLMIEARAQVSAA